ncbi:MAG: hypothetical protein CVU47_11220 [Chloroflexi bacterium HGW-Chloroflexi-9]|nr:MAG: hypothetical protein CVU47_11220 [Chloroflexi bacterium HGW-Chloroflexi-9]
MRARNGVAGDRDGPREDQRCDTRQSGGPGCWSPRARCSSARAQATRPPRPPRRRSPRPPSPRRAPRPRASRRCARRTCPTSR